MAFHSVSRLLFHDWIQGATVATGSDDDEEDGEEELSVFPLSLPSSSLTPDRNNNINNNGNGTVVPACAEQALLRVSLILHENTTTTTTNRVNKKRRFDPRVRIAARTLASELRSRKCILRARQLLSRSTLLVVDHGLANGSLDGLRERFPPASPASPSPQTVKRPRSHGTDSVGWTQEMTKAIRPDKDMLQYASAAHFLVTVRFLSWCATRGEGNGRGGFHTKSYIHRHTEERVHTHTILLSFW